MSVGQDQLGEDYLTYSHIGGFQNTLGSKYALHIQDIQAPPKKSCMRSFPPAWIAHGIGKQEGNCVVYMEI